MALPPVAGTVPELRATVASWRGRGERVGLVPTMGALHEGHLALVRRARELAERVVVSIFVNPKQFAASEDFGKYPRVAERDRALLADGADLVFAPDGDAMYPPGFATDVTVGGPSGGFEGAVRPGHFAGVATVVTKLFTQCGPDFAVFGEKDWQQLQVVRRLVSDLDLPLRIVAHETVRDDHGLALSSRNAFLDPAALAIARRLNVVLRETADRLGAGEPPAAVLPENEARIVRDGFEAVDYLALVDAETLRPVAEIDPARTARLLVAARLGSVRLLDNMPVGRRERSAAYPSPPGRG